MKKIRNLFPRKKILLIIILGMFLLTVVAAEPKYIGKQYDNINIMETCVVEGFPCPADFLCNITIAGPDLNVIVLNQPMTKNDTMYNYTFVSTDLLGDYEYNVFCSNLTLSGNEENTLRVTTTGREVNLTFIILILVVALVLFLIAILVKNYSIGFLAGILFLMGGTYAMVYGLGDLADMYTRAIAVMVIAFGAIIVLTAGIEWLDEID